MKEDQRGKVIDFLAKHSQIPRTPSGDPGFTELGRTEATDLFTEQLQVPGSVLDVFTPDEVVAMVNRYLYSMEYQRTVHRNRERDKTEALAPLKAKVKELFGVPWTKATDEQIGEAAKALKGEQK